MFRQTKRFEKRLNTNIAIVRYSTHLYVSLYQRYTSVCIPFSCFVTVKIRKRGKNIYNREIITEVIYAKTNNAYQLRVTIVKTSLCHHRRPHMTRAWRGHSRRCIVFTVQGADSALQLYERKN